MPENLKKMPQRQNVEHLGGTLARGGRGELGLRFRARHGAGGVATWVTATLGARW